MSEVSAAAAGAGRLNVDLKPRGERQLSADQVIEELRPKFARVPGVRVVLSNPPSIRIGGMMSRAQYQFSLQDPDTEELYRVAPGFETALRNVPGLLGRHVGSADQKSRIERDPRPRADCRARPLGRSGGIGAVLGVRFAADLARSSPPTTNTRSSCRSRPQYQQDPAALSMLYVQAPGGKLVPLSAVVTTRQTVGPQSVNHIGQLPSVTLSFNIAPGVALGDAVARVEQLARETLPGTVSGSFQGTAQAFQDSLRGLGWVLALAIFVIYVVLGILYESFIHPITILSGLPSAGFGALLTLLLFHQDLNIYAFVGVIMLVGLVKKNGIMMIDFAIEARRGRQLDAADAIYEACMVRFRPIMMTTMAALMGTLPIALGWGAGAEARRPLGLAVVGGLLVSQTLTLYVTPVFYIYMERLQERLGRRAKPALRPVEPRLEPQRLHR